MLVGCEQVEIPREDFIDSVVGTYETTLETHKESMLEVILIIEKIMVQDHNRPLEEIAAFTYQLELNGELVDYRGWSIPNQFIIEAPTVTFSYEWKFGLQDSKLKGYIDIDGLEYYVAEISFIQEQDDSYTLKEIVLWQTGFIPPPFKKKYVISF